MNNVKFLVVIVLICLTTILFAQKESASGTFYYDDGKEQKFLYFEGLDGKHEDGTSTRDPLWKNHLGEIQLYYNNSYKWIPFSKLEYMNIKEYEVKKRRLGKEKYLDKVKLEIKTKTDSRYQN